MIEKKRILVLGAGILQLPLISKIKASGYEACVVSLYDDEPGMLIADYPIIGDYCNEEGMLDIARKWDISGVAIDQTDLPVRTAAYIAEKLHLPGIGYDTAKLFTDKYAMRKRCRELGLPTLRYQEVKDYNEACEFFQRTGDVILKPVSNQGSKGVYRASSLDELRTKYYKAIKYARGCPLMIEEFVTGDELVIEAAVNQGKVYTLCCGDTFYFDIPDTYSANMRIFPSRKDDSIITKAQKLNQRIIKGFGLHQGITHGEYIVRDGEVYLIEIAARGGGVYISSHIIPLMSGLDSMQFVVNNAVGIPTKFHIHKQKKVVCYVAFYLPQGQVATVEGVDVVLQLPYVRQTNLAMLNVGRICHENTDKTSRFFIVLEAKNNEDMDVNISFIRQTLKVIVVTDEGEEQGIIWN